MKSSKDIEILRLRMELNSIQSRNAFLEEKLEDCVSRSEYDAKKEENASLRRELSTLKEIYGQETASLKEKLAEKDLRLKEYQETQELLKTENLDFKTLWEFWQRHRFGASSETMTDMMDRIVGKLPTSKTGMLAEVLSFVDRLNNSDGAAGLPAPVAKAEKKTNASDGRNASGRPSSGKNRKTTKCIDVREVLGPDFSDMPPGYKVIMRKGKPDSFVIELIFMDKPHAYSKKYEVARCNIPGNDPKNSKYPPVLFDRIPVDPSFASFCLEMKFGYNMPESRILEILEKAGCKVPQATLNRWMHAVTDGLYNVLMPEMKKAVKASRFTHNDETRILVRSQEKDEEKTSYKTEYIHGILSPERKLFIMLNDLDFGQYIETVLRRIQSGVSDIAGMLPNVINLEKESENTSAA